MESKIDKEVSAFASVFAAAVVAWLFSIPACGVGLLVSFLGRLSVWETCQVCCGLGLIVGSVGFWLVMHLEAQKDKAAKEGKAGA
jgi:hypothetical protein